MSFPITWSYFCWWKKLDKRERIPNILEKMQIQRARHTFEIWKNEPWSCILGKKWVKILTSKTWPPDWNSQSLHFHPDASLHFTKPLYFASSSLKHWIQWRETQRCKRQRRGDLMLHSCMEQTTYCVFFLFLSIFVAMTERVDFVFQPA